MSFPAIRHCLVCQTARGDSDGTVTVLGLLGVAPYVQFAPKDMTQAVALSFVMFGGVGGGEYECVFQIERPDGAHLTMPSVKLNLLPRKETRLIINGIALTKPTAGTYRIRLIVNGTSHFESSFLLTEPSVEDSMLNTDSFPAVR